MKLGMYSIRDEKAEAYITPFFLPNDAMAIRSFKNCLNDQNHQFGQNPDDYILFKIGIFDDYNSEIERLFEPLASGADK